MRHSINPVRAGIVKRPEDHEWTGHLSYLGREAQDLIDEGFILDQFAGNRALARRRYRQFVWEGVSSGHDERYYQVKDQCYLGEESFIDRVEAERKEGGSWVYEIPMEAISREVCRTTGISEDKLYSGTKGREGARGRAIVGYLARRGAGCTVKEIADYFNRSSVSIGEGIMKVEDLVWRDKSFEEALRNMEENIVKGRKRKYRVSVV